MERNFLIVSIFITLGAIAFLSGYLFLMPNSSFDKLSASNSGDQSSNFLQRFDDDLTATDKPKQNILPLSSREVISFLSYPNDPAKVLMADKDSNIIEVSLSGLREKVIKTFKPETISDVIFSPKGESLIYSSRDIYGDKKYHYLNLKSGDLLKIVGEVKSANFSPDGQQAVYLSSDGDETDLVSLKDGSSPKKLLKTRISEGVVNWPADFVSVKSSDADDYDGLFVLKDGDTLNRVLSDQKNLNIKWSPSGKNLLFSNENNGSNQLFIKNIDTGKITDLGFYTEASRCVWLNDETGVICGIKDSSQLKDRIYRINIGDLSKNLIAESNVNLRVGELTINTSGNYLFILNEVDGKLYYFEL